MGWGEVETNHHPESDQHWRRLLLGVLARFQPRQMSFEAGDYVFAAFDLHQILGELIMDDPIGRAYWISIVTW